MSVFIIDTNKPEGQKAIQELINIGKELARNEKPITEWIRPDRAKLILGGADPERPVSDNYLKQLRQDGLIRYTELPGGEFRYHEPSLHKLLEERSL